MLRADDRDQQPVKDLCDDRLASSAIAVVPKKSFARCSWCCSSRAEGRRRSCKMPRVCALTSSQNCSQRMAEEYQGRRDRVIAGCVGYRQSSRSARGRTFRDGGCRGLGRPSDDVRRFLLRKRVLSFSMARLMGRGRGFLARLLRRRRRDTWNAGWSGCAGLIRLGESAPERASR